MFLKSHFNVNIKNYNNWLFSACKRINQFSQKFTFIEKKHLWGGNKYLEEISSKAKIKFRSFKAFGYENPKLVIFESKLFLGKKVFIEHVGFSQIDGKLILNDVINTNNWYTIKKFSRFLNNCIEEQIPEKKLKIIINLLRQNYQNSWIQYLPLSVSNLKLTGIVEMKRTKDCVKVILILQHSELKIFLVKRFKNSNKTEVRCVDSVFLNDINKHWKNFKNIFINYDSFWETSTQTSTPTWINSIDKNKKTI